MNDSAEVVLDGGGPIWRQIERQIRRMILCGQLVSGEELPSVRALAVALAISPRAVERAYNRLESAGLVTRVDDSAPHVSLPAARQEQADQRRLCEMFLREAAERGHSRSDVLRAFQTYLEREVPS
jgi:GntR family transcriptional regulator